MQFQEVGRPSSQTRIFHQRREESKKEAPEGVVVVEEEEPSGCTSRVTGVSRRSTLAGEGAAPCHFGVAGVAKSRGTRGRKIFMMLNLNCSMV